LLDGFVLLPLRLRPMSDWTIGGLWLAVIASGVYHGINPGMGWPLAVAAASMGRGRRDLVAALGALAGGHFVAMAAILLPFAALTALVAWQSEIRILAGLVVVGGGIYLLIRRRHPRFLVRISPSRLALWSFAVATAHGAGLMLVPIFLGLCSAEQADGGEAAARLLMAGTLGAAFEVAAIHATAMLLAGGALAYAVHRWLGPKAIARSWINLETSWALSLVLVGGIGVFGAVVAR
jgi:hypothetical protein